MSAPMAQRSPAVPLDVQVRFSRALVLVRVAGEFTASAGHLLEDALDAACAQMTPDQLLMLDMSRVSLFEPAALASLGPVLTRVLDTGIELRIKDAPFPPPKGLGQGLVG